MEHSPLWQADSCSANQAVGYTSRSRKVRQRAPNIAATFQSGEDVKKVEDV
jgi:hypothetical protein